MAQGLVTVMSGGKVRMKIIVGSDGSKAHAVATAIKALGKVPTVDRAWSIATKYQFGGRDDRVVMSPKANRHTKKHGSLPELYRESFHQPIFNPRWQNGSSCHIAVIHI